MKAVGLLVILALALLAAGAAFVFSGAYDVAADEPHWPLTAGLLEALRERSVEARAAGLAVPADLADASRVRRGAGNYDAMCVGCHLRPGLESTEIRKGLYPEPPDFTAADDDSPAERFWVIKHGLKMTAMPAWSQAGVDDATIWDMVALLQKMPALSEREYAALVAASEGHTHHVDPPGAPPHGHDREKTPAEHDHAH